MCKKHLPNMAKGYSSPKLTQYIGDGFEYMRQHENEFDVVITDSSDPVGMYHHYHHCHRSSRHPPIWEWETGMHMTKSVLFSVVTSFAFPVRLFTVKDIVIFTFPSWGMPLLKFF